MKLFIALFLLLTCVLFAASKDTVIINTVRTEIDTVKITDTVFIEKEMDRLWNI